MEERNPAEGGGLDLGGLLDSLRAGDPAQGGGSLPDLSGLLGMLKGPAEGQGEEGNGGVDFAGLLGLLGGIGGGEEKPPPPPAPRGDGGGMPFDPAMLSTLSRAMAALREPDRNILLLQALRPFLEPERQKRVDEAVKLLHLMRLAPLLQESGLLSGLLG
ncbi:MAG: hypothetical protein HFF16_09575 [Angelakisella sp.]|jgi:hypothetical protein|nr:hypothetical protein [Angelakisella sp.]MCI9529932.1 hypothetical protein [Angelakisella sp.]